MEEIIDRYISIIEDGNDAKYDYQYVIDMLNDLKYELINKPK